MRGAVSQASSRGLYAGPRLFLSARRSVVANVAKPEVVEQRGVFSKGIHENEILHCPEIRERLTVQASPFLEDNNAGGGYVPEPTSQVLTFKLVQL